MTKTDQGNIGEAIAICELTKLGYAVSVPLQNNLRYDLIVDLGGRLSRVQVKTTSATKPTGWDVFIATSGGNTKRHTRKKFDASACEFLFVVADNKRCWLIPTDQISSSEYITVGNKKYSEFELGG